MRHFFLSTLFMLFGFQTFNAQDNSVSNVLNLKSAKSSGEIFENDLLVGYFMFFMKEKTDKDNVAYEIELFDDNYNLTKKFDVIRSKNTDLNQIIFNGSVFVLYFYNPDSGYEFATYDGSGVEKGSIKIIEKMDFLDGSMLKSNPSLMIDRVKIYSNSKNGFILASCAKSNEEGCEIVGYDNDVKQIWIYKSKIAVKTIKFFEIKVCSEDVMTLNIFKSKREYYSPISFNCILLNPISGEFIKEIDLGKKETGIKTIINSFVNLKTNNLIQIGEFYKPNDNYVTDKSDGFYITELSLEGELISSKEYKWVGEIDKYDTVKVTNEEKKFKKKDFSIFFHDLIVCDNGHVFIIGEQYANHVSTLSLSGSGIIPTALIGNMIILELNSGYDLINYKQVKKKKNSVEVPLGFGSYTSGFLGHILSSYKLFNFSFISKDKENDFYDIVYFDSNRKENKESFYSDEIIGVISIKGGICKEERFPINCETFNYWIQPAKPGFISITEYSRKERKIKRRLEPISY